MIGFVSCVKNAEKYKGKISSDEREPNDGSMPVLLAIGVAGGWMFLCAAIFLKFEKDWDYFKSFYFFFCSLTTIGYGISVWPSGYDSNHSRNKRKLDHGSILNFFDFF